MHITLTITLSNIAFGLKITFDNQAHSGRIKVNLDTDVEINECRDWSVTGACKCQFAVPVTIKGSQCFTSQTLKIKLLLERLFNVVHSYKDVAFFLWGGGEGDNVGVFHYMFLFVPRET